MLNSSLELPVHSMVKMLGTSTWWRNNCMNIKLVPNRNKLEPNRNKLVPNRNKLVPNRNKLVPNRNKLIPNRKWFNSISINFSMPIFVFIDNAT